MADRTDADRTTDATTLEQATIDAPTLLNDTIAAQEPRVLEAAAVDPSPTASDRYHELELLGEGGMGEVRLCEDRLIGRRIARKVMRAELGKGARTGQRARFLREARVQGQLEHPAIVPVYDLGCNDAGNFFTMKRVIGLTLDELFDKLRMADALAVAEYNPHKLLAVFAQICLAVHYAHARGVIHRDLKPSNLMLGHFGEVYVLDWGLAKILAVDDARVDEPVVVDQWVDQTGAGTVVGTPAYAAPEQLRAEPVDARTDVWALGAILFEMMALEPLNPHGTNVAAMMGRTLRGLDARCSVRAPHRDVPPELEAICVKATALEPSERYQSAREMEIAIERFLSGDRDRDARRKLAQDHEAAARAAATEALAGSLDARARALTEIGRAIALDPESPAATALLYELVNRAPRETPPEVKAQLDSLAEASLRRTIPIGGVLYPLISPFLFLAIALWMGIKNPLVAIVCISAFLVTGVVYYRTYKAERMTRSVPLLILASLSVVFASALLGPFVFVPALATINVAIFSASAPHVNRTLLIGSQWLAVLVPVLLEWLGFGFATHEFLPDGSLKITSAVLMMPSVPTFTLLVVSSLFSITVGGLFLGRFGDASRAADSQRLTQKWQIEQLLPREARVSRYRPSVPDAG